MELQGRTYVVTGGTGALGTAVVGACLAAGARCKVPYRNDAEADAFAFKDRVTLVPRCDLTSEADVARLYDGISDLWASIHIAGSFAMGGVADTDKAALMRMFDSNVVSCYLCCRAAVLTFGAGGGRIVNVTSRPALEPRLGAGMSAYTAAKAAVAALTQTLAAELVGRNVLVNAVAPSVIDTPANRAALPKADHDAWVKPEEIAVTIGFLASPANTVTNGAVVPVYGRA
ncbi:MAG: short-chain dehydrogenase/reductase family protein [Candidatus Eremiobacteraeota bacterium]|nr:short-chain dehydrogenase/reductase family protein [Candidatus Eremiobacteraeota bacterium]